MQVHELDPAKQYAFVVNSEHATVEDVNRISDKLKALGIKDPVVLADVSVRGGEGYYGLYCRQCARWWVNPDAAQLLFYPAPEIANAHLNDTGWFRHGPVHLWQVQKFGEEEQIHHDNLPPGSALCPVWIQEHTKPLIA